MVYSLVDGGIRKSAEIKPRRRCLHFCIVSVYYAYELNNSALSNVVLSCHEQTTMWSPQTDLKLTRRNHQMTTMRQRQFNRAMFHLLRDYIEVDVSKERRAKFEDLCSKLQEDYSDQITITDGRTRAWTPERKAQHAEKVVEAAKEKASNFTHYVTVSQGETEDSSLLAEFAVFDIEDLARAADVTKTTLYTRLGSVGNTEKACEGLLKPQVYSVTKAVGVENLTFQIMRVSCEWLAVNCPRIKHFAKEPVKGVGVHQEFVPGSNLADLFLDLSGNKNSYLYTGSERQRQSSRATRAQAAVVPGERQPSASQPPAKTAKPKAPRKPRAMKKPVTRSTK